MELNIKILSGNPPPLPSGYSAELSQFIHAMLSTKASYGINNGNGQVFMR
jgi:hypothetical protein